MFTAQVISQPTAEKLIQDSVDSGTGSLTKNGCLRVQTGQWTGRAAKDKYIVESPSTAKTIWWENQVRKMTPETFQTLKEDIIQHLNQKEKLYHSNRSVGAHEDLCLEVDVYTSSPHHALFTYHLFREPSQGSLGKFTVYHAPFFQADPKRHQSRSETIITTSFDTKEILICGTQYAGEIKKSLFSVMNYLLPQKGYLPMHAGANESSNRETSLFFGLSGTGKTTLSTDEGFLLIGDDEHGLDKQGIFNFEGGCYAKTIKLSADNEPEIYKACTTPGALLENVVLKEGDPDFDDNSLSENGRASYPLSFIPERKENSRGNFPKNIFFLTADAFGVLPPVAKLSLEQAKDYFLLGYTAKVAGTELGVTEPEATFSACFGAPFMMWHPQKYASLLEDLVKGTDTSIWLINTGWTEGPYGQGHRFPIKVTRSIIRAIQANSLKDSPMEVDPIFNLVIPTQIPGVDSKMLKPKNTWKNPLHYDQMAQDLKSQFDQKLESFQTQSKSWINPALAL